MSGTVVATMAFAPLLILAGCRNDMHVQPKILPLSHSDFFEDGRGSRTPPAGTIARGQLRDDTYLYTGMMNGKPGDVMPFPATREVLERGRERFNIYCTPCHSQLGDGNGMIVQRGFRRPPSFHEPRLRQAPLGHFYDVMTNGSSASCRIMPRRSTPTTAGRLRPTYGRCSSARTRRPTQRQAQRRGRSEQQRAHRESGLHGACDRAGVAAARAAGRGGVRHRGRDRVHRRAATGHALVPAGLHVLPRADAGGDGAADGVALDGRRLGRGGAAHLGSSAWARCRCWRRRSSRSFSAPTGT